MNFRGNLRRLINEVGCDFIHQLPYPHVDLFFWRPDDGTINFGDHLSIVVVDHLLRQFGYTLADEVPRQARLFAIGSVLHYARNGDVIWGSGVNGRPGQGDLNHRVQNLDVRAVRGPRTREVLQRRGIAVPEVFGDPALLLPQLFPNRFRPTAKKPWVFVPNLHDLNIVDPAADTVVSPLGSWNRRIDAILEAELVLASSLHGIIVAEAFGIPARYVRLSSGEAEFKYHDYYEGTGRFAVEFATSIDEGREMGGAARLNFDHRALMSAFPIDLWSGKN
ncbi:MULTISPECIES: polysaccharide pyruvyl transferase family protein [Bradyrhizobium]|uniref:Pyruvyl transferase n=1 Tax=Bradyrhizobium yuanmingense TaxID=108015 RepID=A0A1C3WTT7_9BRAD|nr:MULTISPECIES: polysaccharide pyruvyl transferase family protein [Bradyrhizobium]MCA1379256.1 polysaccharide pyruvyl transferase family protein [Bradyrhizobium sp. BRP05]MCA1420520.1 polysaccharide pyruvyl transferase family protein [Bradyrhizobium sp. BRP23]MCA1426829.1 polysaccharide pyruvyl transferase family protein [Bradyrhizobium sp. NBAIM16]MCA1469292.1 polysaccharide pyruvyl transferase family protein [Bradyrhizobium sp. IC3195]MCA1495170.1 polysaccharide pyruvyl transferase family p